MKTVRKLIWWAASVCVLALLFTTPTGRLPPPAIHVVTALAWVSLATVWFAALMCMGAILVAWYVLDSAESADLSRYANRDRFARHRKLLEELAVSKKVIGMLPWERYASLAFQVAFGLGLAWSGHTVLAVLYGIGAVAFQIEVVVATEQTNQAPDALARLDAMAEV